MGRLDGKVALITGGARGQGAAEARLFAREGARVVFGDVRDELGQQVEAEIQELAGEATYIHLDVTSTPDWEQAIALAESKYGKLDVLVNNAAIFFSKTIQETTGEDWDQIMDVNAKSVFIGTKLAIPAMRRAGGGSIVNISSTSGIRGIGPAAYIATKGAVRLFTKATAIQYAKENIRANSVHPGVVDPPMVDEFPRTLDQQNQARSRTPMGRRAAPEEIAYGVLYLASDEASFVTGSELVIDGGATAQ
jgi:NAD(P)-dependent dehydrogenase (short-subunit alcohol dehydrogenase family)